MRPKAAPADTDPPGTFEPALVTPSPQTSDVWNESLPRKEMPTVEKKKACFDLVMVQY